MPWVRADQALLRGQANAEKKSQLLLLSILDIGLLYFIFKIHPREGLARERGSIGQFVDEVFDLSEVWAFCPRVLAVLFLLVSQSSLQKDPSPSSLLQCPPDSALSHLLPYSVFPNPFPCGTHVCRVPAVHIEVVGGAAGRTGTGQTPAQSSDWGRGSF